MKKRYTVTVVSQHPDALAAFIHGWRETPPTPRVTYHAFPRGVERETAEREALASHHAVHAPAHVVMTGTTTC